LEKTLKVIESKSAGDTNPGGQANALKDRTWNSKWSWQTGKSDWKSKMKFN